MYRLNGGPLKPIHDWVKDYEQAWSQRFDRLDAVLDELKRTEDGARRRTTMTSTGTAVVTLPGDTQILITREFDAPAAPGLPRLDRAGAGQALVEPATGARSTSVEVDLRVGGTWRYVMTANGGFEVAFHGEYREIVPDERLVSTEVFEGMPDESPSTR